MRKALQLFNVTPTGKSLYSFVDNNVICDRKYFLSCSKNLAFLVVVVDKFGVVDDLISAKNVCCFPAAHKTDTYTNSHTTKSAPVWSFRTNWVGLIKINQPNHQHQHQTQPNTKHLISIERNHFRLW
jgi:hypothetical protein